MQETEDVIEVNSGVESIGIPPVAFNNMLFKVMQKLRKEDISYMRYLNEGNVCCKLL